MDAWQLPSLGSVENLRLVRDLPDPSPAAGEVVIRVEFAALNPADRYLAENQYPAKPTFPHVLGRDGVGTVIAVGEGVTTARVGDGKAILRGETGVNRPGTLATHVVVNDDSLVDVPAGWTHEQAAAAPLVYLTAMQAITQWQDLPEKPITLITGATGGVGVASVQLAKAMGHTVVGLSRSEEKSEQLRGLGADLTFDPNDATWPRQLSAKLGGKVDLAIDNIGGAGFNPLLSAMNYAGRISVVGALAGPVPSFNTAQLFGRRLKVGGVFVSTYTRPDAHAAWSRAVEILTKANARPQIDHVFDFDQVPQAFARLHEGPMGKVLIRV